MIPTSTIELLDIANSKYAVVVAVAKRARVLSEKCKTDENYRLSTMVTRALDDVMNGQIMIHVDKERSDKEA